MVAVQAAKIDVQLVISQSWSVPWQGLSSNGDMPTNQSGHLEPGKMMIR